MNNQRLIVCCALLIVLYQTGLIQYLIRRRVMLLANVFDALGIQSSIYMTNVSCPGCNRFDTQYVIDARANIDCSYDHEIFLVMLVVTEAQNFNRRTAIRHTWGSIGEHKGHSVRTFFVCGRSSNDTVEAQLRKEATYWGDIVQVWLHFFKLFLNLRRLM